MAKVIECVEGLLITADGDDQLVSKLEEHLRVAHPSMVGTLSRAEILAMATERADGSVLGGRNHGDSDRRTS